MERPVLPLPDRVGDAADGVRLDLGAVELGKMTRDLAYRHAARARLTILSLKASNLV